MWDGKILKTRKIVFPLPRTIRMLPCSHSLWFPGANPSSVRQFLVHGSYGCVPDSLCFSVLTAGSTREFPACLARTEPRSHHASDTIQCIGVRVLGLWCQAEHTSDAEICVIFKMIILALGLWILFFTQLNIPTLIPNKAGSPGRELRLVELGCRAAYLARVPDYMLEGGSRPTTCI